MAFDWISFFNQHNISYAETGPNTSKGNVAIHCVFCGTADETQHLSISLDGHGYRCWRNREHRGRNPVRLVQALLGCSWEQAQRLVGGSTYIPNDFLSRVNAQLNPAPVVNRAPLTLPPEFKPFSDLPSCRPFMKYMLGKSRGFTFEQVMTLTHFHDLRYCTRGPDRGRVIFPIHQDKRLVTWTGRTIYKQVALRYKTLTADPEKARDSGSPCAVGPISDYLLWHDKLKKTKAHTICLVEGPMDAAKVWVLGAAHGIVATCFFTSSPTDQQIELLHEVLPRFRRRFLLLDQNTLSTALLVEGMLKSLDITNLVLPPHLKDPGEIDGATLLKLCLH